MSDKTVAETVAELMALHHAASKKHAEWCMCGGPDEKRKAHESLQADVALEQAIRRAVDLEQVAWGQLGMLNGRSYLRENYDRTPYPPPADVARNLNLVPLYARRQDQ